MDGEGRGDPGVAGYWRCRPATAEERAVGGTGSGLLGGGLEGGSSMVVKSKRPGL